MIAMRPFASIRAHIGKDVILEINTSLTLLSCSYIVSTSLQSLHKTHCVERNTSLQYIHGIGAMMRTAQQQAVAWFTLSRGVLVHATLTSTQLKSVVHAIQSVV